LVQNAYPIHAHIDMWVSIFSYMNDMRIVGTSQLHLKHNQQVSTDIQPKEGCAICNVPTHFNKEYAMISKPDLYIARASQVCLCILVGYLILKKWK